MPSIPLTPDEERRALEVIGRQSVDDLFSTIPPRIREKCQLKIDPGRGYDNSGRGLSEHELRKYFQELADKNATYPRSRHFLGGGVYDNIIPAIVNQLVLRGEFLTCYTPYQPEVSQGTLQVIFEFQTMISRITGMPVANASMYDGATATAEAILMAQRLAPKNRQEVLIAESVHPEYQGVADTFLKDHTNTAHRVRFTESGTLDLAHLAEQVKAHNPACLVVGYPNYFGIVEPLEQIRQKLPKDCLLVVSVPDLSALSIFEPPGSFGADIVAGEAHQMGTPMLFGGPHVGFFASKKEHLRQMPGRLCGETVDKRGDRAYTLTLSTREQHIRREKATSNICTNQGLIALRTTIYLSFLGKRGFVELGEMNYSLFAYLTQQLDGVGIPLRFKGANHYREGVFEVPNLDTRFSHAVRHGTIPGIRLKQKMTMKGDLFTNSLLIAVNPKHTKADIDALVEVLSHD